MSIVAVHGPHTFGSSAVYNSTKTFSAFATTANGLTWRFVPADQTQVAANYDWTWANTSGSSGGTPASPVNNTMNPEFTFPVGPATKTITLTLNGVAQPTLVITIPGATGLPSPMMVEEGDGEDTDVDAGFDPAAHTVDEVEQFVTEHPDQAQAVYDLEVEGKARVTLITWLEEFEA